MRNATRQRILERQAPRRAAHELTDKQRQEMQALCLHQAERTLTDGRTILYTLFVQWGDDSRYQRCRHCGKLEAHGVATAAAAGSTPPTKRKRSSAPTKIVSLWDLSTEEVTE